MYKLLIADDETIEREAIKYIINENLNGMFDICEACNGREAIEKAKKFNPDIIFFDIKMPGINGLEAASKIHSLFPECRIILMSAYQYFNYAKDALSAGADDYIVKPAPVEKTISALENAVAKINEMRMKKKKEEEMSSKLQQITKYLEEELLSIMTSGEIEEESIKYYLDILNIKCNYWLCSVLSIDNGNISGQNTILINRIIEKFKEKLKQNGYEIFSRHAGGQIYLLLLIDNYKDEDTAREASINLLVQVKDEICKDLGVSLSQGIGCLCSHVSQIYNSFLQAKLSLKGSYGKGITSYYGELSDNKPGYAYPLEKERMLYRCLIENQEKESIKLLDEIFDWMVVNTSGIENLIQKVYELLLVLMRELSVTVNQMDIKIDTEKLRSDLTLLDNSREIRIYAKKYIISKMHEINNLKLTKVNSVLSIVIDFIEKNYSSDISLEDAAELVNISPYYLSKLFKQETGENFIDYLTSVRIKKAKKLLSDPRNNVKDICYKVGYKDPNYFTRVFKKICGITPTEYKCKNVL